MEARIFENQDHFLLRRYLSGKQFVVSILIVCSLLLANVVVNVIDILNDFNTGFLLFQPLILFTIEFFRNAVILSLIAGLIKLLIKSRKSGIFDSISVDMIERSLVVGAIFFFLIFFFLYYQFYLFHLLFSVIFVTVILGSINLFARYMTRINTLPFDEKPAIPNPGVLITWLIIILIFLVFHFLYISNGGTYSLFAAKGLFLISMSLAKFIVLVLLDVAIIYLIISLYSSTKEKRRRLQLVPIATAGVALVALVISIVLSFDAPKYTIDQFENPTDYVQYIYPSISTRDTVIFPVETNNSNEMWLVDQTIYYNFGVGYLVNLYYDMNMIPSISSNATVILTIPDSAQVYDIVVYDKDLVVVDVVQSWEDLALLPEGNYVVKLMVRNTIYYRTTDVNYLFILNVE